MIFSHIAIHYRPLTDDKWKALEESVLHSGENFDGKIQLPSTFHDIIAKLDSSEVINMKTDCIWCLSNIDLYLEILITIPYL